MSEERQQGKIARILTTYGFVRCYPPGEPRYELFFHRTGLRDNLIHAIEPGDLVSFEISENDRGKIATDIVIEKENHLI